METPIDARLIDEVRRYRLRFACDQCAHFAPTPTARCSLGWPLGERDDRTLVAGETLTFCKSFESE
jgi:hypothetical protein